MLSRETFSWRPLQRYESIMNSMNIELEQLTDYCRQQLTTGLLIIQNRQTILEHNWPLPPGSDIFERRYLHGVSSCGALREDVASQQKSVIAMLAAIAVDRGLLDIEQPVSRFAGKDWSRASAIEEQTILVRHLLEMCSGLDKDLRKEFKTGVHYYYNTPAYAVMLRVLEEAAGQPLDELTRSWLTDPVGMKDTGWCYRIAELSENLGNSRGLVTTPRDLSRIGQLVIDGGIASCGTPVVSKTGLASMFKRTELNPAYGRLWWLNGGSHWTAPNGTGTGSLVFTAPDDAIFALGSENRVLMVVPSQQLILIRLGQQAPDHNFREKIVLLLSRAMVAEGFA